MRESVRDSGNPVASLLRSGSARRAPALCQSPVCQPKHRMRQPQGRLYRFRVLTDNVHRLLTDGLHEKAAPNSLFIAGNTDCTEYHTQFVKTCTRGTSLWLRHRGRKEYPLM